MTVGGWRGRYPGRVGGTRGAVAAEFALVAGILFVLLFALVDLGRIFHVQLVLTQAVREGARRAAVLGGAKPEVFATMEQTLRAAGLDLTRAELDVRPRSAIYGTAIRVEGRYRYPYASPILRSLGRGAELVLRAEAVTRSELLDEP